ncbi:cysteine proteinase [Patellaria atrata CBS 101060]|uniref:ubiquitinyl hydrolase 1 n=1 Tax=Patellaria atrata CBS 101060 TaxID=1346257 RepID=A0A9P4VLP3_9PEZI|nr:cysteine proteinase [Patellaria atrata CBS 101060]
MRGEEAGRLLHFTTASNTKKRRIAPVTSSEPPALPNNNTNSAASVNEKSGLASPRSSPHPLPLSIRRSASPPRYLPPHLHEEILEATAESAGFQRENNSSAASSPSEAYAGLTLESSEGCDTSSSNTDRRGSTTSGEEDGQNLHTSASLQQRISLTQPSLRRPQRCASPAKRAASEMEERDTSRMEGNMDIDNTDSAPNQNDGRSPTVTKPAVPPRPQNQRQASVDMLREGHDNIDSTKSGNINDPPLSSQVSSSGTLTVTDSQPSRRSDDAVSLPTLPRISRDAPSIDQQVYRVMDALANPLNEGDIGYVLSGKWFNRVLARTSEAVGGDYDKSALEGDIGPVTNIDLLPEGWETENLRDELNEKFIPIRKDLSFKEDYELVTQKVWEWLMEWYGFDNRCPPIVRYAHDTAPEGAGQSNVQYELHPPIFTIRKVLSESNGMTHQSIKDAQLDAPRICASTTTKFQAFLTKAKESARIEMNRKVKLWRVIDTLPAVSDDDAGKGQSGMLTPATSREVSPSPNHQPRPKLIIDVLGFTSMVEGQQREMVDVKDHTSDPKYNGGVRLGTVGLAIDQTLILEEQIGGPAGGEFVSDSSRKTASRHGIQITVTKDGKTKVQNKDDTKSTNTSGRNTPVQPGPLTRGRARKDGRTRGSVGLMNLGNTCYMNSALQCIRSVEELTIYFLKNKYKEDLNPNNPLGHNGQIAKVYAGLLASVYDDNSPTSFSPKNFKYQLGRSQPLFSGYGQQDSQEFLSFLVDGLHEDLNRVLKKPYTENPESDDKTVNDPEAIKQLGEKFRQIHHSRNDSIAMDIFNGFYKNTMVCPVCDKVSITFDPFSLLTLQLPFEQTWTHQIIFIPLRGPPIQIAIDMDKNGTIKNLKEYIAKRIPGLDWKRLMMCEIYNSKFYKTFDDRTSIIEANIQPKDDIVVYEIEDVPTNFPPPPKKQNKIRSMVNWNTVSSEEESSENESPLSERMLVPVFHRRISPTSYSNARALTLWPGFILLTREEAKDADAILRKVLNLVAGMTTKDIISEDNSLFRTMTASKASDTVLTTDEDASSDDPKVKTRSVEGEEGMVDVSMSDSSSDQTQNASSEDDKKSRSGFLAPGSFIPPECRSLFDMKYLKAGREIIPTGWSSFEGSKDYPSIESRIPQRSVQDLSPRSSASNSSTDDVEDIPEFSNNANDALDGDESDISVPPVERFNQRRSNPKRQTRGRKNKMVTYSRKGKSVANKQASRTPPEVDEDAALIRLREAILLDWNPQSYEALFEGLDNDDLRGHESWKEMVLLEDPELVEKKAKRNARKKSGITLDDCFAETAKSEILSEENAWYCNRCKELRRASKTLEIWTVPDILVVHLKRFSANRGLRDKVDLLVDFPIEGLDLTGRVGLPEDKSLVYDLFAVDNHYGGLGGGHYTAFAQNFFDKKWYEYNDSMVTPRKPESVVTTAAYLLFYRRRSETPLGPPYLQQLVETYYNPTPIEVESQSQSSSRAGSPAGKGRRLDGSSPNGSSSASAAVGATHQRGGGGAGGPQGIAARSANASSQMEAELPAYQSNEELEEDEGVAMGEDAFMGTIGPANIYADGAWDWTNIGTLGNRNEDEEMLDGDDAASDTAMGGSEIGDQQLLEDFGDEGVVPVATKLDDDDEEMPQLVTDDEVLGNDSEEDVVAEVRVGDKDFKVD